MSAMLILTLSSFGQDKERYYTCVSDCYIHSNMGYPFNPMDELVKDASIKVIGIDSLFIETYKNWEYYYHVKTWNNLDGWVLKEKLMSKAEVEKAEKIHLNKLIKKYGSVYAKKIMYNQICLGMTESMVKESLGVPDHINTDTYSSGIHEQWIYNRNGDTTYVYFENYICTAIQER